MLEGCSSYSACCTLPHPKLLSPCHTHVHFFPECSYICISFPATNYHICIVVTHAVWVSVGLPWGPRWDHPGGVVLLRDLSMHSESFLPCIVLTWLTEKFVDFSGSWCLLVYLHFFRMCFFNVLWCIFAWGFWWSVLCFLLNLCEIPSHSYASRTPLVHQVPTLYVMSCTLFYINSHRQCHYRCPAELILFSVPQLLRNEIPRKHDLHSRLAPFGSAV